MSGYRHGGDHYRNVVDLDFSISVNPFPLPERVCQAMVFALKRVGEYPDLQQEKLKKALGHSRSVSGGCILPGNGASELLLGVFHAIRPETTFSFIPDYNGYGYCSSAVGSQFIPTSDLLSGNDHRRFLHNMTNGDLLVFSHPNNPTGQLFSFEELSDIIDCCKNAFGWIVIDASFLDLTERANENWNFLRKKVEEYERLMVLTSVTKSFALAGLRLGYLIGHKKTLARIGRHLPEWNISVLAEEAGIACADEAQYLRRCAKDLQGLRADLAAELMQLGIQSIPSQSNYLLLHTGYPLYQALLKKRILIRDCRDFQGLTCGWYRLAVRTRKENAKLLTAVRECVRDWNDVK